jgi:predicted Zn-dependent protease
MYLHLPLCRIEEALQQARASEQVDPLSPEVQLVLAYVLLSAGRYEEADKHCQQEPAGYLRKIECLGRSQLAQGRIPEAIRILATADPKVKYVRAFLGHAYGRADRREEAEEMAVATSGSFQQALVFAGLGDRDRTLEALDRMATTMGSLRVGRALTDPEFALLRADPRLSTLRKKVGFPE